jgi:hypothetical protein
MSAPTANDFNQWATSATGDDHAAGNIATSVGQPRNNSSLDTQTHSSNSSQGKTTKRMPCHAHALLLLTYHMLLLP